MNQETARLEYIKKAFSLSTFGASFFGARDNLGKSVFVVLHARGFSLIFFSYSIF